MKLATCALMLVPLTALAVVGASCSVGDQSGYSGTDAATGTDAAPPTTPPADSGEDSSKGKRDSGNVVVGDANASGDGSDAGPIADSGATTDSSTTMDSGAITDAQPDAGAPWVDMNGADGAADPHACDNRPGVACGWSASNNGLGYTCRCANPTWADPWGCEAPDSGTPEMCPAPDAGGDSSTGGGDSGSGKGDASAASDASDASAITDAPADSNVGWIDMNSTDGAANPHACDNQPGVPCGWSPTNNGLGYTCRCVNPTWADPWGCEAPDSGLPASCP